MYSPLRLGALQIAQRTKQGLIQILGHTILVLLPMTLAAAGDDEAKRWLEKMVEASRALDYEGTFVYVQGEQLEAMHISHSGEADGKWQRVFSLNGLEREVVVANNQVTCLLPTRQKATFDRSNYNPSPLPITLPDKLDKLEDRYDFKVLGDDRVAGKRTRVIAIEPRDPLRFGYRFWLEQETGMVLRSALIDETGSKLEQLMFTDFQINPQVDGQPSAPPPPLPKQAMPENQNVIEEVEETKWQVTELPEGFAQIMHKRFPETSARKHPSEHMVFTDGLATVSVFLEPLNDAKPLLEGASRMGAMNAFGKVIAAHQVIVVGEVPPATVAMIASSLRYASGAAEQ
jgi:sigma-E factor negative regulatory protein RseB